MTQIERNTSRRAVLWAGRISYGNFDIKCQVWNISLGGAKVNVGLPLANGTIVKLHLDKYGDFDSEVVWQDGKALGLRFTQDPEKIRRQFGQDAVSILGLRTATETS